MNQILIIGVAVLVVLIIIGIIFARLYKRTSKGMAFVRTGWGGSKVCLDGGMIIIPIIHDTIDVNMNTLRLDVSRSEHQALITKDRLRVDVTAEFYVRVKPDDDSIATAAQTLGSKTLDPRALRELTESKFTDALRSVASNMEMEELHEKRSEFVQKVQQSVMEDLAKNGLELESVSLTGLDQTNIKFFNENNAFDAQGLTKLTETIESKRKARNEIEQTNRVSIEEKNLETTQKILQIKREEEYSTLQQQREVAIRRAEQAAEIATKEADRKREAEEAEILARREVNLQRIDAERQVEEQSIRKEQQIKQAQIEQERTVELADQDRQIAIHAKSQEESEASKKADEARVAAVRAQEQVITARDTEIAERQKAIEIIEATKVAEKDAVGVKVQAEAEREAAENFAQARITEANAQKQAALIIADGKEREYAVEAEGKRILNEALNILSADQVELQLKAQLIANLANIVTASVKPMENIDSIKIVQMNGAPVVGGAGGVAGNTNASLPEQVVNAALQHRMYTPLVDDMLKQVGMNGLGGLLDPQAISNLQKVGQSPAATTDAGAETSDAGAETSDAAEPAVNISQDAQHVGSHEVDTEHPYAPR